jgi:manganese transport protein
METENTIDPRNPSESRTVAAALDVLDSPQNKNFFSRLFPFLGPAFIASVAYIDPGNFATNIAAGAQFGYLLIWVIVVSNLMAMLVQTLSAKLGIVTGMNLAQHCRRAFPKPIVLGMWFLMELVAMATDLAEFLGAALGFNLLLGVPLFAGAVLTAITTFIILGFERYGFRPLEAVISGMVGVVTLCYIIETIIVKPVWKEVLYFAVVPHFQGAESVVLASGILGATVMPHAIFLHSALTQGRIVVKDTTQLKRLYRFEIVDVVIALGGASFVNAAMLIMAAATFHQTGMTHIATIEEAYRTLEPLLGKAAGWFFGLSLLVAGLSSSTVGTSAGQVIMEGFLNWHIPVWLRRLVTMAPSLIVIGIGLDPTHTLVMSQVILSFGLPFAIVPLVIFTARRDIMGDLVNRLHTTVLATLVAGIVILLNGYLLYQTLTGE